MDDDTEVLSPENLIDLLTEQADEGAIEYVDTLAKLFVAVAEATPDAVVPAADSLAARLADEDEF